MIRKYVGKLHIVSVSNTTYFLRKLTEKAAFSTCPLDDEPRGLVYLLGSSGGLNHNMRE